MEFYQFHPTCLYHPQAKSFLITEALRGEGAFCGCAAARPSWRSTTRGKELAPRDVVARAIDFEMKRTGDDHVLLDMTAPGAGLPDRALPGHLRRVCASAIDMPRSQSRWCRRRTTCAAGQ